MTQFILGSLAATLLGAGLVWAQSTGYTTDQYGNFTGRIYQQPTMPQQDWMAPSRQMGQQLDGILQRRNPC